MNKKWHELEKKALRSSSLKDYRHKNYDYIKLDTSF